MWTATIFIIWSMALVWGSWQLHRATRELAAEQREMRRWKHFSELRDRQQRK